MTGKRFVKDCGYLEDRETNNFYVNRDDAYIHILNVLYGELKTLENELKEIREFLGE